MEQAYMDAATAAANLEKQRHYLDAAKAWKRAESMARMNQDEENEKWANARADWCLRGRGEWKFGGEA